MKQQAEKLWKAVQKHRESALKPSNPTEKQKQNAFKEMEKARKKLNK